MKRHKRNYWLSVFSIVLIMGCATAGQESLKGSGVTDLPSGDILARVGTRTITVCEFGEKFSTFPSNRLQAVTVEEQKEKFLERFVQRTLLSFEASEQGIDREESVANTIRDRVDSILAREYFERKIQPQLTVTDDEIKNYYDSHPDEFRDPVKVMARHILVRVKPDSTQEEWDMALKMAVDLKKEINNGASFAKLAKEKSDDSRTKWRGGALRTGRSFGSSGYLTRENIPAGFPDVVFSLAAGEISEPVKGIKGYHIIKVDTKRPEKLRTLDQVKAALKQKLIKQKHEEIFTPTIERLKEKYKVVLNTDLLNLVKVEKKGCGCNKK